AGGLRRHPPGPVPREPGGGRHRHDARRRVRRRAGAGQARRDLHAEGSGGQDGRGAPQARRAGACVRRDGSSRLRGTALMLAELGQVVLVLALLVAALQALLPLAGAQRGLAAWMAVARPAAYAQLLLVAAAFAILSAAFVGQDFSLRYVAENSNSLLPWYYRYTAVWGAHEGSLLLWALILALWTGAVARFSRRLPADVLARVLGVMGLVSVGFLAFLIFTSNPFARLLPAAAEGHDLNPLLQDPGMIVHPPMLYLGYVGFSVPFAFAIAALLGGEVDARWLRWTRPWTNVAWAFLTAGIALGS